MILSGIFPDGLNDGGGGGPGGGGGGGPGGGGGGEEEEEEEEEELSPSIAACSLDGSDADAEEVEKVFGMTMSAAEEGSDVFMYFCFQLAESSDEIFASGGKKKE